MIMDTKTIVAMWDMAQSRFHNMVSGLPEDALSLAIGPATIGYMLRHSAEVEYVYAEWVFGKSKPEELTYYTLRGPAHAKVEFLNLQEHIDLLKASHATVKDRKSTRLNSSHVKISYAVFCLNKKNIYGS